MLDLQSIGDQIPGIKSELESLDEEAQKENGALFGDLGKESQQALCDHLEFQ